MRQSERLNRWLRRTDTRVVISITALLLAGVAAQSGFLYAFVGMEAMEEADSRMALSLRVAATRVARGDDLANVVADLKDSLAGETIAVRVLDSSDDVEHAWGRWPAADHLIPAREGDDSRQLFAFRKLQKRNYLIGRIALSTGQQMDVALPLGHFVREAGEIGQGLMIMSLGSGAIALLLAIGATVWAFQPLRRATEVLRRVDARHLSERLPVRGTGDPVDRHARTLNEILENIDSAFARLRAFSSDVSHELRTPLNRIGTVADVALLGSDEREVRSAMETIRRATYEMSEIVDSLLLIAEFDDARSLHQIESFDAKPWIARSVEAYSPLFEERGTRISFIADPATVTGDRALLDRVLVNLLENALHHTAEGARVEVHCRQSDDGATISVEDSGPGIPPGERERVFDRFVRLGTGGRTQGHGLGLALARAIARLHRGDLSVEPSSLGGARFVWRIPLRAESVAARSGRTLVWSPRTRAHSFEVR